MARDNVVIEVDDPKPIDSGILDQMFGRSQAISDAVQKFWGMNLAASAELGAVTKTATGYAVEIVY